MGGDEGIEDKPQRSNFHLLLYYALPVRISNVTVFIDSIGEAVETGNTPPVFDILMWPLYILNQLNVRISTCNFS